VGAVAQQPLQRSAVARHFLKHPINHANMEVHMLVEAGAEAVDEGDCADMQMLAVSLRRTGAVGTQALCNNAQEDAQHHVEYRPVALPALRVSPLPAAPSITPKLIAHYATLTRSGGQFVT
jgi:hypothetical protein